MAKPKTSKNVDIPDNVLKSLLTPSEQRMLKNRFAIIGLLEDGLSIRNIAEQLGVGTDTVVRVSRMMEKGDLKKFVGFKKTKLSFKTRTPWIFGKSD